MYTVTEGSRAEVFHGTAKHTSGGLVKGDLVQDKYGNIKSKAAVAAANGLHDGVRCKFCKQRECCAKVAVADATLVHVVSARGGGAVER